MLRAAPGCARRRPRRAPREKSDDATDRGSDRRQRPLRDGGARAGGRAPRRDHLWDPKRRRHLWLARTDAFSLSSAPRLRPPDRPAPNQLPGEFAGPQAARRRAGDQRLGGGLDERVHRARRHGRRRSVHRPHPQPSKHLLRGRRRGRARRAGGARGRRARRGSLPRLSRGGRPRPPRRHLRLHRRPAVLDPRRVAALPQLGRRRDRHDQPPRGPPRPRSRAPLRHGGARDRLRLLAPDRGFGDGRGGPPGHAAEHRDREGDPAGGRRQAPRPCSEPREHRALARHHDLARPDLARGARQARPPRG